MCASRESALLCIGHSTYKNIKMADKFFSLLSEVTVQINVGELLSSSCCVDKLIGEEFFEAFSGLS